MKFGESETVELKKSTAQLKKGIISIVSILNKHHVGKLYFGIDKDGNVLGQLVSEKTLRGISQAISNHIEPDIFPVVEKVVIEGKDCILVVFEGDETLYYAYGKPYIRVADEDKPMSPKEVERLILKKGEKLYPWDGKPSKLGLEDVNEKVLKDFIIRGNEAGRINFKYIGLEKTLKKLNLLIDGKLTNAAEVLFCDRNPLEVQTAIFAGNDKLTFLDINQFKGNLFYLLKEAELYVKNHMRWSVKFGKMEREEIPEVPVKALREALMNSLCHKDYVNPKGNEVALFKDRIEIYNPGQFPDGYEPEDFIKGEENSVLRNPLLANTLFLSKDIEKWGSGIKRIHDECQEEGVNVDFKKNKSGFVVLFHRRDVNGSDEVEKPGEKTRVETEKTRVETEKTRVETEKTRGKLLVLIEGNPKITIPEMAESTGISEKGIEWQIKKLKDDGVLIRKGPTKSGHWEIVK